MKNNSNRNNCKLYSPECNTVGFQSQILLGCPQEVSNLLGSMGYNLYTYKWGIPWGSKSLILSIDPNFRPGTSKYPIPLESSETNRPQSVLSGIKQSMWPHCLHFVNGLAHQKVFQNHHWRKRQSDLFFWRVISACFLSFTFTFIFTSTSTSSSSSTSSISSTSCSCSSSPSCLSYLFLLLISLLL